jgi:hypothetical protein
MIVKFLLIFIFSVGCSFANDNDRLCAPNHARGASAIMRIVIEQAEAIQHYDGERLYLKAEKIYHTNAGPALCNDRSAILLPNLSVNQLGYYLFCRNRDDYKFIPLVIEETT